MNYYIDFDNTLYETARLTQLILEEIENSISELSGKNVEEIKKAIEENFNSSTVNFPIYAKEMAKKYKVDEKEVIKRMNNIINCGEDLVFKDAINFLKKLKEKGHNIYILTYIPKNNQEYQMKKIIGSGIAEYFDRIIITTDYKFNIGLDYKNGIFIDDDPRDLKGLYEKNPIEVIRIRKENNKKSKIDINNKNIREFENFDNIEIPD